MDMEIKMYTNSAMRYDLTLNMVDFMVLNLLSIKYLKCY